MSKSINDAMLDYHDHVYANLEFSAAADPYAQYKENEPYNHLCSLIGKGFELEDNDFYSGIFTMIQTAQELKRANAHIEYLYNELNKYDEFIEDEVWERFYDTYKSRDNE
jgi:hypothetical protein